MGNKVTAFTEEQLEEYQVLISLEKLVNGNVNLSQMLLQEMVIDETRVD